MTAQRTCPICQAPTDARYRPFCSRRCADVDLGRWFGGRYRVAGEDGTADPGAEAARQEDGDPDRG